jgi:GNAT superfamily N-acetyltransferase
MEFIGEATLVAHNAKFDIGFIKRDVKKYLAIDIVVADEYRGQGLADYMVRKIVQSHGPIRHLMWNAGTENEASLKLARRYGFVSFATTTEPDNSTTIHLIRKAGGR